MKRWLCQMQVQRVDEGACRKEDPKWEKCKQGIFTNEFKPKPSVDLDI